MLAVFWFRNDSVRIRIMLSRSFRIRILLCEKRPGQVSKWPIVSVYLQDSWNNWNYVQCVFKDEFDHFSIKIYINTDFVCQKDRIPSRIWNDFSRSGSDLAKRFGSDRIRIHNIVPKYIDMQRRKPPQLIRRVATSE
jgi:hypothetical protein